MQIINSYIVTFVYKINGKYTTMLHHCENNTWYILTMSTFGPGTVFTGLNNYNKIDEKEALQLIEDAKKNIPV